MKRATLVALAGLLTIAGCGSDDPQTPAACLSGADAYLDALEAAPGAVLLEGTTPIGDCLIANQPGGELGQVGAATVEAATELNARAQNDPAGNATVQLGYLVGAVQQAAATTGGIHRDLVLRLDSAARFKRGGGSFPASFERAFGAGYAAGQAGE